MTEVHDLYKQQCEAIGGCSITSSSFSGWKMGFMRKVKTSNISRNMQPRFCILSPSVCKNNRLLNKNYRDDLDITDLGHSKGNVSRFCIYLGYPWTNVNQISSTMSASWLATKVSYRLTILPNFHRNDEM